MASVLDKASGQVVQVPDADLHDQWKAGKVEPIAGQRYQVQLANGSYGTVPAEDLGGAFDAGAHVVSPAEAQSARLHATYGASGGARDAFAGEALSQATAGLADQALLGVAHELESTGVRPSGYANAFAQELQAPREEHPYAAMAGAGVGAAGLAAVLPGGGLAGLGERGALALTEGAGESVAAQVARRALVQGARGALEGTQMGVAQAISDDAFDDHNLASEHILSTIGGNALWGGALGAGMGFLGGAAGRFRAPAPIEEALARGNPSDADLEEIAGKALDVPPAPGLGAWIRRGFSRTASAVSGKDADVIDRFAAGASDPASAEYRAMMAADETRDAASRAIRGHLDEMLDASRDVTDEARGQLKRGYVRSALADAAADTTARIDPDAGLGTTGEGTGERNPIDIGRATERDEYGRFKRGTGVRISPSLGEFAEPAAEPLSIGSARIDAMANKARGLADHALSSLYDMRDAPEQFGGAAPIKNAVTFAEDISKKLDAAILDRDVAEQFALVDDLKKGIGTYTKGASRLSPSAATDELVLKQNRARAAKYQSLYETLRQGLEDESTWGKAGTDQQAINAAWTQQIDASNRFHRALTTDIGRDPDNPWQTIRGVDPAKADAYVRGLMNPAQDLTHKAVRDYVDSTAKLSQAIGTAYELPPESAAQAQRVQKAAAAFRATLDSTETDLTRANQWTALQAKTSGPGAAFAAMAGLAAHGVTGGVAGLALGKVAGMFTQPAETILQLARIQKFIRESDGRIARNLRAFGNGATRAARPLDTASFARKAARIQELSGSADTVAERLGASTAALRTKAPRLADALVGTSLAGLQLLRDKLPPTPPADPFEPHRQMPAPPPGQREQWLRYYDAVTDPHGVLDDLVAGRVAPEGVEVLRTVYPGLFQQIRNQAATLMMNGKMAALPKQRRLGLAMTLDMEIPELAPAYIAARQLAWSSPMGPAPSEAPAPRKGKPVNLAKSAPSLTAERVESGGGASG